MRLTMMIVGWMLGALGALQAAEADPAAPKDVPAAEAPVVEAASTAEESPAPTPTGYDWSSLEQIPRWTIENEHAAVEISSWRGSIRRFWIKSSHPIPVPKWRGGQGDDTKTEDPLPVLDLFLQPSQPLESAFGFATDMQNYLFTMGLRDDHVPVEGPWELIDQAPDRLTVGYDAGATRYRLTYRMDPDRPTVRVSYRFENIASEQVKWQPRLVAINGIHQDDPLNERYDLKLVGSFDAKDDGTGATFDKWSLPDPYDKVTLTHPDLSSKLIPASRLDFVGIKSRFFTAFFSPGSVSVVGGGEADDEPAGEVDASAIFGEDTGPHVAADDHLLKVVACGYPETRGTDEALQAWIALEFFADGGEIFEIPQGQALEANWSITCASMQSSDLEMLTPAEQRIQYTDGFYNFFKILVKILTVVLDAVVAVVQNYGIAVIIFVVLVKGLLHKLNVKQQKGMAKMQEMAPKLKALQEQYKHDRQALAKKQMELMQKEGANPLGGCLPLLIQMPIFFAMFQTFRHYADLREHGFLWVDDLTMPDQVMHLFTLPFALPLFGSDVTLNFLPLLYIAVMTWSSFSNKIPEDAPDQQKQMAKMMRWLPIVFGVVCYNFAAGLLLYMCCSALIGTLEMKYIRKKYGTTGVAMPA